MKIYTLTLIFSFIACTGWAQLQTANNLFNQNPFSLNPAYAGASDGTMIGIHGRRQYAGIDEAPQNALFSINGMTGETVGVGAKVHTDRRGIFSTTGVDLSVAYRARFNDESFLQLGLSGGMVTRRMDNSNADLNTYVDREDPTLNDFFNSTRFRLGAGIMLRAKGFEVGLSAPFLIEDGSNLEDHYVANVGYTFQLNDIGVQPYVMTQLMPLGITQTDFSIVANWKEKVWLQPTYRTNGNFLIGSGVNLKEVGLGYSFELATGDLADATSGTHEVFIRIDLKNRKPKGKPHRPFPVGGRLERTSKNKIIMEQQKRMASMEDKLLALMIKMEEQMATSNDARELEDKLEALQQEVDQYKEIFPEKPGDYLVNRSKLFSVEGAATNVEEVTTDENVGKDADVHSVQKGYYIVIQTATDKEFSKKLSGIYQSKGYANSVLHNPEKGFFYIYTEQMDDLDEAIKTMRGLRTEGFSDAWVLVYK